MVKHVDKYVWSVGSAPPPLDPHSVVKHEIVREYLSRYVQVLMSNYLIDKLVLSVVDGFAGGGEYSAGGTGDFAPGSPQIVLDTLAEQEALLNVGREKPRTIDVRYYFVEKKKTNLQYLNALLTNRYGTARMGKDILTLPGTFQKNFDNIRADIQRRGRGQRAIFLLDQYAWDQIPGALLKEIFSTITGAEVILTFGVDSLISFLSDNEQSRQKMAGMGFADYIDWKALEDLRGTVGNAWRAAIQRNLANALIRSSGAQHSTIFYVTPMGATPWTYWLVHLSNNYKARDVMMEIHWAKSNHFSHYLEPDVFTLGYAANADNTVTGQSDLQLGEEFKFDRLAAQKCSTGLERKLVPWVFDRGDQAVTFQELAHGIGSRTPATERMLKESLNEAIRSGDLIVQTAKGGRRMKGSSLRGDDRLSAAEQRSLIYLP
jgi:three-Cys-motif partner protein